MCIIYIYVYCVLHIHVHFNECAHKIRNKEGLYIYYIYSLDQHIVCVSSNTSSCIGLTLFLYNVSKKEDGGYTE